MPVLLVPRLKYGALDRLGGQGDSYPNRTSRNHNVTQRILPRYEITQRIGLQEAAVAA